MDKNYISQIKKLALIFCFFLGFGSMVNLQGQAPAQGPTRQLENLGPTVNSEYDDVGPVISADGKTLFFTRENSPQNVGGVPPGGRNQDIWFSKMGTDGKWQAAENFTQLNTEDANFITSVTPDGNVLLMGRHISYRTKKGWSDPVELSITDFYNNEKKGRLSFNLTHDGQTLIMSLERRDSKGFLDLYVSFLQTDGTWTAPSHMGPVINSFSDDLAPFLAADGKTLYFSSDGHKGSLGGFDIYRSKRLDNSWKAWSVPENLGPTINSKANEAYFTIPACGDRSYMSSTDNAIGKNDIFSLPIPANLKPEPVMLLTGTIVDVTTNEALEAKVEYKTAAGKLVGIARTNPATGDYTIVLPRGDKYKVSCIVPNYVKDEGLEVDITGITECQVKSHTHKLRPNPTLITGKVVNGATNAPLPAKMSVTPSDGSAQVDVNVSASGEYKFELSGSAKGCTFNVVATGFNALKEGFEVPADKLHGEARKDFVLKASAIGLSGKVLSEKTKTPVGNATIKYRSSINTDVKTITTSAEGDFKIDIPAEAAQYTMDITAVGFYPAVDKFSISTGDMEAKREILMKDRPPLMIFGKITNQKTKAPLGEAKLKTMFLADKKEVGVFETNSTGDYRIDLNDVTDYTFKIRKDGFISIYPSVRLTSQEKFQEIRMDTSMIPIEIGTTVRLNNIQFEYNKATLLAASFEELNRLMELMEDASKLVIEIAGHTDSEGPDAYNLELSNKRATSVREYLLSKGVSADRIQSKGYGETKPLVDNKTEKNRAINRRVEFRVLKID